MFTVETGFGVCDPSTQALYLVRKLNWPHQTEGPQTKEVLSFARPVYSDTVYTVYRVILDISWSPHRTVRPHIKAIFSLARPVYYVWLPTVH